MSVAIPPRPVRPAPTADLPRLARFAAQLVDAPVAALSLGELPPIFAGPDAPESWRARREAPLSRSLCRYVVAGGKPLLISDARVHPLVAEDPLVWLGEAAYLGVPVYGQDGVAVGCLCVLDAHPRTWSDEEVETMEELAAFAALALAPPAAGGSRARAGFVGTIGTARGRLSLRMLEKSVETMQVGVTITGPDGRILYTNPAEARMHGYTVDELRGRHARIFAPAESHRPITPESIERLSSWSREAINVRKDGSTFPVLLRSDAVLDSRGRTVGLVTCCEDLTERKELERRLLQNSFYDPLTALPNRGLLTHRLDLAVERAARGDGGFAVLVVGLDRFKRVNDGLGREAGDELLRAVAERLRGLLPGDAMVARLGADEFGILLDAGDGLAGATRVARRVQDALARSFRLGAGEVFTAGSVGIALSPSGYQWADDVLRDATIAMYRAKDRAQGGYEVFDLEMHAQAMERLQLESDLRRALERGELRVHYQPVIALETGAISGFEALCRWEHPERGLVFPDAFITLAEETGLILPLGMQVLEAACRTLREWQGRPGFEGLTMAVNLSPKQFAQPDLVERVDAALRESGIEPGTLRLEITESVILHDTDPVTATLHRLKTLGVKLYLDDFGTGYSSLSYLHRIPLDALKIDRGFVRPGAGTESAHLVRTILAMARALDVTVVTEGVETAETVESLRRLGCEFAQGYFFAHPMDEAAAGALLAADPRW